MNIPKELSYKHQRMASSRTEHKDLKKKISTGSPKDLLTRTCARSRRDSFKGFHQDLYSFSQGIVKRSQGLKGSLRQDLQESAKMSTAPETRAIPHAQSTERVVRVISKCAPRHNKSDLTRTKCRKGCASDIKIRTGAIQQAQGTKSREGLCEHMLKLFTKHCAHHGK